MSAKTTTTKPLDQDRFGMETASSVLDLLRKLQRWGIPYYIEIHGDGHGNFTTKAGFQRQGAACLLDLFARRR